MPENKHHIRKLDENLINQIAAGEVVERPASVLKELLDNAVDAGATHISVQIKNGGIDRISVIDNGIGIPSDQAVTAIKSHTTSKLTSPDDLMRIATLGFRGEALASIAAVSEVEITTRSSGDTSATRLSSTCGKQEQAEKASREVGTTVTVAKLFHTVPARKMFLKAPRTEYRKLLEVFIPVVLIQPHIHFTFESDGKTIHTLPAIIDAEPGTLHPQRVKELFPDLDLVDIFYDGESIVIEGMIAHPSHKSTKTTSRYIFVNGRPVWDSGIAKSVQIGTGRFLPEGMRVPFFVSLRLPFEHVDVNVHPRKTEVRFANPYRIYAAVESAIQKAYETNVRAVQTATERLEHEQKETNIRRSADQRQYDRFRPSLEQRTIDECPLNTNLKTNRKYNVEQSLSFSRSLLEDAITIDNVGSESKTIRSQSDDRSESQQTIAVDDVVRARQYLGRYIVAEVASSLLIVDQHAAAERIRFEQLLRDYQGKEIAGQQLMIPVTISLAEPEAMYVDEQKVVFEHLGYDITVHASSVTISSVPAVLASGDHEAVFNSLLGDLQELEDFADNESKLKAKYRDSIIATMACHSSVRMQQKISDQEAVALIRALFQCDNAYACPHGRPIVWRLVSEEIDRRFDRV